jgi:hypothetical protein
LADAPPLADAPLHWPLANDLVYPRIKIAFAGHHGTNIFNVKPALINTWARFYGGKTWEVDI